MSAWDTAALGLAVVGLLVLLVAGACAYAVLALTAQRQHGGDAEALRRGDIRAEHLLDRLRMTVLVASGLFLLATFGLLWEPLWTTGNLTGTTASSVFWRVLLSLFALLWLYWMGVAWPRRWGLVHAHSWRRRLPLIGALTLPWQPLIALAGMLAQEPRGRSMRQLSWQDWLAGEHAAKPWSPVVRRMIRNAVNLHSLVVSDVLLPRHQVKIWDLHESVQTNLMLARETGHTRFPLCEGDLDRCIGLIHVKDLFRYAGDLRSIDPRRHRRHILRLHADEPLEEALSKLLRHNMHMALVLDAFRGVVGVLTLERILEQLVGDIKDEFDAHEEELIQESVNAGERVVSGLMPLHELEAHFQEKLANEEVSTLGGLITQRLGFIPRTGATLRFGDLVVEVEDVDETRVISAKLRSWSEAQAEADAIAAAQAKTRQDAAQSPEADGESPSAAAL